ncbi:UNVERIFIED_CONTAM: hypothetical protein FKN15_075060 [Acipenser sinensis]
MFLCALMTVPDLPQGLHPSVRPAGWEFLMNFHPWKFYKALNETVVQNPQVMTNKEVVLTRSSINTDVIRTFVVPGKPLCEKKRSELQRVLIATYIYDRVAGEGSSRGLSIQTPDSCEPHTHKLTITTLSPVPGYQQGLHEMGMVLQTVMKTECDVFWALRSLLQKTDYTSIIDVGVMKSIKLLEKLIMFLDPKFHTFLYANCKGDLFFLFNWFVLLFLQQMKNNTEVLRLWEVLMTRKPCPRFHVFIALAILQNRKKHLLSLPQDESSIITQVPSRMFYSLARRGRCVSVVRLPTMANGTTENTSCLVNSSTGCSPCRCVK